MSLAFGQTELLRPPSNFHRRSIPSRQQHRAWKRRRLKLLTVRNDLNPIPSSLGSFLHGLLSQIPSGSSLNYIAPTLGIASGLALLFSSGPQKLLQNPKISETSSSDIGEWILFTTPTPFNRFVTLRCPSIYFPENDSISEKLVKEDRHYVKLNSGIIIPPVKSDYDVAESMVYQRLCVSTEDGGVLSLDWPAHLDLEEEHGLDTTVLVIPGTPEGSNERKIGAFVCDCLRRGVFPVVLNPRGCAGSPLTTPRLFTAADSDDISTAVQYINKKRPRTTLMAVGWEYGANMLTKYLAERGERTPLTAATCIDNPFDLEEATRSFVYHTDSDQMHTDGLINILQCNKELFQGRGKGFDVEGALTATSVRDFERAISMVSYGFDTIEEFYAKSSTRDLVGKVKVPVLFIQNDDRKAPLFSIPRSLIAENPYTSLLLCSYKPSSKIMDDKSAFSWCQHLTLEWLTAVELGLLKGRHPLLKDVDVTVNPSKGLALVESRASSKRGRVDRLLNSTNESSPFTQLEMFQANDPAKNIQSRSAIDTGKPTKVLNQEDNNVETQSNASVDAIPERVDSIDSERGHVLQTAEVVFNMLDITMPNTLADEQKKKVLNAVGRGETLIKALQDAVPEDVRGKLTTAVSGILQSRKTDLQFDKLLNLGHIPEVASELNSKVVNEIKLTEAKGGKDVQSLHQEKKINGPGDGSSKVDSPADLELEKQSSDISQKQTDADISQSTHNSGKSPTDLELQKQSSEISLQTDTDISQSTSNHQSNRPDLEKVNLDKGDSYENEQSSGGNTAQISNRETVSEINVNQELSNMSGGPDGSAGVPIQKEVEIGTGEGQADTLAKSNKQDNGSNDQEKISEAYKTEENSSVSEAQAVEHEAENNQKKEEKGSTSELSKNISDPPSFSVTQALDAFTGFDDSTQVAVNSVFNVIEGMIDQMEVEKDNINESKNKNDVTEVNGTEEVKEQNDPKSAGTIDLMADTKQQSGNSDVSNDSEGFRYNNEQQHFKHGEYGNSYDTRSQVGSESEARFVPAAGELPTRNVVKKAPSLLSNYPFGDPLYKEYLKTYLSLKVENSKPRDMDKLSELHLDYIPEEGQWKLLEQTEDNIASGDEHATCGDYREDQAKSQPRSKHSDNIIEPSYVILDSGELQVQNEVRNRDMVNDGVEFDETKFNDSTISIKSLILECLNVEVGRKTSGAGMEDLEQKLAREIEYVADAVSKATGQGKHHSLNVNGNLPKKLSTLDGENIIRAISCAVQETQYLRTVVPIGVVVGSSLAALRKFYNVVAVDGDKEQTSAIDQVDKLMGGHVQVGEKESSQRLLLEREDKDNLSSSIDEERDDTDLGISMNNKVMVGAVTAALGASALLANQQNAETGEPSNEPLKVRENSEESAKLDEMPDKTQNNIVSSLAEKAMSVAGPVVPFKEDGGVDHERLVAMLAELGQKGGMLKLVGKLALLWGGIRGAISLADKLISFLHLAERPLFQRILGFAFMVLLLWSPVFLPLLPSLMQSWATGYPFKLAEVACIAGLYAAIMIMITLWGKRIRKYDDPLQQYGFNLASAAELQNFMKGMVGGSILVIVIHAVNSSLGCAHLCWPTTLYSSSLEPIALMKSYGRLLMLSIQGIATASGITVVEELFFRSWLPKEIAADFGYHRGVLLSGLLFAISQRSIWEVPGLWLLSLSLSGAQQRTQGSLSLPIGVRTGILACNFILRTGGFLTYLPNFSLWVMGSHPFQPFSGVVGLAFSFLLAVFFYPRQITTRVIRD